MPASTGRNTRWKPGQIRPGRPKGSRSKLGEEFIAELYADFMQHGAAAIERVRIERPEAYLKVIAALVPREIQLSGDVLQDATDDELNEMLRILRSVIAAPNKKKGSIKLIDRLCPVCSHNRIGGHYAAAGSPPGGDRSAAAPKAQARLYPRSKQPPASQGRSAMSDA